MSVWLCIPSARPAAEADLVLALWRKQGYKIALWRDPVEFDDRGIGQHPEADVLIVDKYPGYAGAVNGLARVVLHQDPSCDWIVCGGDDTEPDPNHSADEIAAACTVHFAGTFGVMQPTGDRFASGSIDRIAGSPWLGREWCQRANRGFGPFWPEFTHMFGDECLQRTAELLHVFWQRPDLVHLHRHFMRDSLALDSRAVRRPVPEHLVHWNSPDHWNRSKAIFKRLEAQNFAPCMPL